LDTFARSSAASAAHGGCKGGKVEANNEREMAPTLTIVSAAAEEPRHDETGFE
jgi:hypothetical protein